jgi:prepilin-type processing-associated H-X9-DG protein
MKLSRSYRRNHGLTLMETVAVAFVLVIMVAIFLPALNRPKHKHYINCTNNQKQIGLSFRLWEGDNNDKYPMAVSVTNGGAMEAVLGGNPMWVFQVMSNELSTPRLLVCPEDTDRQSATNFTCLLTAKNVSYFVNPDAIEANPQDIMGGDDNLEINSLRVKSGLSIISSNSPVTWSADRHKFSGNIAFADGSVQGMNNSELANWLRSTNFTTMRLAIP